MARRKSKDKVNDDSLRDVLLPVQPRIFDLLFQRLDTRKAHEFAGRAGIDQGTLSDYRNGKTLAIDNLPDIATRTGELSTRQLSWYIGTLLVEHNKDFAFALPDQPREVREPKPRYDLRLPHEEIEDVMSQELQGLDPEDARNLNLDRRVIEGYVDSHKLLLRCLRKAIAAFHEKFATALRRAPRRR